MSNLVRVQHAVTGHQYTVGANKAANDDNLKVLDKPAVNLNGDPLPPKCRTTHTPTGNPAGGKPDATKETK